MTEEYKDGVVYRRAEEGDSRVLEEFVEAHYGVQARFKGARRRCWQHERNPSRIFMLDGGAGRLPIELALLEGKIVGQIAVQLGALRCRGALLPFGWGLDFMVDPACRGRGIGEVLYRRMSMLAPLVLVLTMAPATRRIAHRVGAREFGSLDHMCYLAAASPSEIENWLISKLTRRGVAKGPYSRIAAAAIARAAWPAASMRTAWIARRARRFRRGGIIVCPLVTLDERFEVLARELARESALLAERSVHYLRWRYIDVPDLYYSIFEARRGNDLVGYSVLRVASEAEHRRGVIAELIAPQNAHDVRQALLAHALQWFGDRVAWIEAGASDDATRVAFREFGFFKIRTHQPTVFGTDASQVDAVVHAGSSTHFSKGDHDWDQVYPA